jgi:hypothetical protein
MSRDHIRMEASRASLMVRGQAVASAEAQGLRALLFASSGTDLHATDEEFYVLEFAPVLWVVPDDTPGLAALFDAWAASLAAVPCFEAHCADLPLPWRRRAWIVPLPAPRLGAFPLATAPGWSRKTSVALASRPLPSLARPGATR